MDKTTVSRFSDLVPVYLFSRSCVQKQRHKDIRQTGSKT